MYFCDCVRTGLLCVVFGVLAVTRHDCGSTLMSRKGLKETTVGIIGYGHVGKAFAAHFAPMGVRVIASTLLIVGGPHLLRLVPDPCRCFEAIDCPLIMVK